MRVKANKLLIAVTMLALTEAIIAGLTLPSSHFRLLDGGASGSGPAGSGSGSGGSGGSGSGCSGTGSSSSAGAGGGGASSTRTSVNWVGYVATCESAPFASVTGTWVEPEITCPPASQGPTIGTTTVAFWVGLDRGTAKDPTLEQTGVDSSCFWDPASGTYTAKNQAWFQMVPHGPVYDQDGFGALHPDAGDTITATVSFNGNGAYTLSLKVGSAAPAITNQKCPKDSTCQNLTAEWIAEKVGGRSLTNFAPWNLTSGTATTSASSSAQSIAALGATPENLSPNGRTILAYACDLNGSSFTVQQKACGS